MILYEIDKKVAINLDIVKTVEFCGEQLCVRFLDGSNIVVTLSCQPKAERHFNNIRDYMSYDKFHRKREDLENDHRNRGK